MAQKIVAVKLTETEFTAVEQAVFFRHYGSVSELLREAIMDKLKTFKMKDETLEAIRLERLGHPQRTLRKKRRERLASTTEQRKGKA